MRHTLIAISCWLLWLPVCMANSSVSVYLDGQFQTNPDECQAQYSKNARYQVIESANRAHRWYENMRSRAKFGSGVIGHLSRGSFFLPHTKSIKNIGQNAFVYGWAGPLSQNQRMPSHLVPPGQGGFIYGHSVRSANAWEFEILESVATGFADHSQNFLNGKRLRPIKAPEGYLAYRCCTKETKCSSNYAAFHVLDDRLNTIGAIAFHPLRAQFLKSYTAHMVNPGQSTISKKTQSSPVARTQSPPSIQNDESQQTQSHTNTLAPLATVPPTPRPERINEPDPVATKTASIDSIVCTENGGILNVRNEALTRVLFRAPNGTPLKIFQGKDNSRLIKDNKTYIHIQFPSGRVGWVSAKHVSSKKDCKSTIARKQQQRTKREPTPKSTPAKTASSKNCCRFPTFYRPPSGSYHYTRGARQFNWGRGRRRHAANDIYQKTYDPVVAVDNGQVLRRSYRFKRGTHALEVRLDNGLQALYAEVDRRIPKRFNRAGARFSRGEKIGKIGDVRKNGSDMLHFELYTGKRSGVMASRSYSLPYKRRKDLVDSTPYLLTWEKQTNFPGK